MHFQLPEKALYVFGPEDGGLSRVQLLHCHRLVVIPTRHCTNLGAAIYLVLMTECSNDVWLELTRCCRSPQFCMRSEVGRSPKTWYMRRNWLIPVSPRTSSLHPF